MINRLYKNPNRYVVKSLKDIKEDKWRYKLYYYIFNLLIIIGSGVTAVFATILISKLWINTYPDWYFYLTTSISAMTTLIGSILNFFVIKDKYQDAKEKEIKLESLILRYKGNEKSEYKMFIKTAHALGNVEAQKEDSYD